MMANVLTRFFDRFSQPPDLGPALGLRSLGAAIPPYQAGRPQWPTQNIENYIDDGYAKNVVVFACVNYRAGAVASAPLRVYRYRRGGQEREIADHPLTDLLMRPNPEMSGSEFLAFTQIVIDSAGFVVIEKERARAGNVIGLWPLRSDWIRPIPREQRAPDWEYRVPGREPVVLRSEDVIVLTSGDHPRRGYIGFPPVAVALREVAIENAATDFLKVFFDRGTNPQIAIRFSKDAAKPDKTQADVIKEAFRQSYGGWQQWHEPALLGGGVEEIVKLGYSMDEMAYPELRSLTAVQICSAYRLSPILVGVKAGIEHMTYTNYPEARKHFYEDVATGLWARMDGAFTRGLLPEFESDPSVQIQFDTSDVPGLQEDENQKWQRATSALTAGGLMVDEFRAEVGLPPLPKKAGQVFLLPFSVTPTRPEDLIALAEDAAKPPDPVPAQLLPGGGDDEDGEPAEDDEQAERQRILSVARLNGVFVAGPEGPSLRLWTRDQQAIPNGARFLPVQQRASLVSTNKQAIRRLARAGAPKLAVFWREQGKRITEAATRSAVPSILHRNANGHPRVVGFGDAVTYTESRDIAEIDWTDEEEQLAKVLKAQYGLAGVTSFRNVSRELGIELDWDLANPNVRRVLNELATRIRGINQTTMDDVRRVVGDALDEGVTMQELSDRLTGLFEETYKNRSMVCARTESMVAYSKASRLAFQESQVVAAAELADNPDHDEDYGASDGLTCAQRNGLVVPLDQADTHIDAEHPQGSLVLLPVLYRPLGEA